MSLGEGPKFPSMPARKKEPEKNQKRVQGVAPVRPPGSLRKVKGERHSSEEVEEEQEEPEKRAQASADACYLASTNIFFCHSVGNWCLSTELAAWDECVRREIAAAKAARNGGASGWGGNILEELWLPMAAQEATSSAFSTPHLLAVALAQAGLTSCRQSLCKGQELYMVGSCEELGSWTLSRKVQMRANLLERHCRSFPSAHKVHMAWTDGNIWRAKAPPTLLCFRLQL